MIFFIFCKIFQNYLWNISFVDMFAQFSGLKKNNALYRHQSRVTKAFGSSAWNLWQKPACLVEIEVKNGMVTLPEKLNMEPEKWHPGFLEIPKFRNHHFGNGSHVKHGEVYSFCRWRRLPLRGGFQKVVVRYIHSIYRIYSMPCGHAYSSIHILISLPLLTKSPSFLKKKSNGQSRYQVPPKDKAKLPKKYAKTRKNMVKFGEFFLWIPRILTLFDPFCCPGLAQWMPGSLACWCLHPMLSDPPGEAVFLWTGYLLLYDR